MKRYIMLFCIIPLFFLAALVNSSVRQNVYGEDTDLATKLFQKYQIPETLQHQPICYFLQRMEWHANIVRSGNWLAATRHPSMPKDSPDWSNICLEFLTPYCNERDGYVGAALEFCPSFSSDNPSALELALHSNIALYINEDKIGQFFVNGLLWLNFFESGHPSMLWFAVKDHTLFDAADGLGEIRWDEDGNVISDVYKEHGKKFWDNAGFDEEWLVYLKMTEEGKPISTSLLDGYSLRISETPNDEELSQSLNQIIGFDKAVRQGNILHLIHTLGIEETTRASTGVKQEVYTSFYFHKNSLAQVWLWSYAPGGKSGFVFDYDENNQLRGYMRGIISPIDEQGQMQDFPSFPGNGVYPQYTINGDGIEVKFHPTGYPASYKTFVENELLGRQAEWDEQGNVISYIDTSPPVVAVPQPAPVEVVIEPPKEEMLPDFLVGTRKTLVEMGLDVEYDENEEGHTTETTIVLPRDEIKVAREVHPLPERNNAHWKTVLLANVAIIAAFIALYFYFRRRNRVNG